MDRFLSALQDSLERDTFLRLVLSRPSPRATDGPDRVGVRPVRIRGEKRYQWTLRTGPRESHENLDSEAFRARVSEQLGNPYRNAHLFTTEADLELRLSRKGKARLTSGAPGTTNRTTNHDREKSYLIPEGTPCPFLESIGVMTAAGRVRNRRYGKFRQINRFLELIDDVLGELPATGLLEVVDFGCGKSYLTFALRHLLVAIRGRDARIVALDRDASVIKTCSSIGADLGYSDIEFRQGDISEYRADGTVHLTVALHACDTATDDALAQAVAWGSQVILAAPCCQHELSSRMHSEALELIERHGILKERFAALATDALRASALEQAGYRTQVLEFVDLEHTAKNLLIRAVRRKPGANPSVAVEADRSACMRRLLGIDRLRTDRIGESAPEQP